MVSLLNGAKGGGVVTADMLARTDVFAFELSGGHAASNRGWESSRWVFNDGSNPPITVDWDERMERNAYPTGVVANGSMDASNYASFFGFTFPPELEITVVSYILFALPPTIDITSPNFTITVSSWADHQHGEGTPDPDAIGILACTGR